MLPSVVQINVKGGEESGSGTGIIISSDGNILTNNHVVDVAAESGTITVAFNDGTNAKATIVGTDPKTDLAVIKAEGKSGLTPADAGQLGRSEGRPGSRRDRLAVRPGEHRDAGHHLGAQPSGLLLRRIRQRLVHDVPRRADRRRDQPRQLRRPAGRPEGPRRSASTPRSARAPRSPARAGSIGLGFAIPIDLAKNVAKQLLDGKKVEHAQIGVSVGNFVGEDGITGVGAEVKDVTKDGAAAKAGLKVGDVITAINGVRCRRRRPWSPPCAASTPARRST